MPECLIWYFKCISNTYNRCANMVENTTVIWVHALTERILLSKLIAVHICIHSHTHRVSLVQHPNRVAIIMNIVKFMVL
jgi:hypothetical protein